MEKYAYMMESTDPEYFSTIRDQLPAVDQQKKDFINALCDIEVSMREDMNDQYPYLLSQAVSLILWKMKKMIPHLKLI